MGPCGKGWDGARYGSASSAGPAGPYHAISARNPLPMCTRAACTWYTSHYCEENTLRLCEYLFGPAEAAGVELYVVFISNHARQVPIWCQRLADSQHKPVLWDYHVVLLAQHTHGNLVYDLDSTLPFPSKAAQYIAHAFRKDTAMDERHRQLFRVVPARECLDYFASDRSHMRQRGGGYSAHPPGYPLLRGSQSSSADNMEEWVSMDPGTGRGHVMNLGQMEAFVTHTPHRYT